MQNVHEVYSSYDDYRSLENYSNSKHEFIGGQIFAMTGASPEHERLTALMSAMLVNGVHRGCTVYGSNLRIFIETATKDVATYPDGSVVCGPLQYAPADDKAIINPRFIFEVLSPRTQKYDQTEKLKYYQNLTSLYQVMFISQHSRRIVLHSRASSIDNDWRIETKDSGVIHLTSINIKIDIDRLYESY